MRHSINPTFLIVDLFCGAGGTTTGFAMTDGLCKVVACVNHDHKAIKSHWANHPEVKHFEEDIRSLDLTELSELCKRERARYPDAKLILWASLECTNFSKAKGGQPRDADSRTLADHLDRYVVALDPDYIQIENVVEFMSWGPLDENGRPVNRRNGADWMRWRNLIDSHGYRNEWKELNSADYGAYTSRNRLFGCFAKDGLPIIWPTATHSKKVSEGMFGSLKPWKPVRDVLDFTDEGESIFGRKKPLSDKTYERIYAGLLKYVAKGDKAFISKYFSGRPKGKVNSVNGPAPTVTTIDSNSLIQTKSFSDLSLGQPAGTITTVDHHALVQPEFLMQTYAANSKGHNTFPTDKPARTITTRDATALVQPLFISKYNGENPEHRNTSLDEPCGTVITRNAHALIQGEFLASYYGNGDNVSSPDSPCPTLVTKDRVALVQPKFFIDKHFGTAQNQSIDRPAGSILPTDKHRLVECVPFIMPTNYDNKPTSIDAPCPTITANRKHHYIVNPSHGGHSTSTENPCPVIIARQDKAPLYLVQVEHGQVAIGVYEEDTEIVVLIKQFMVMFNIVDIKMRMLRVMELLTIQGFPRGYHLEGNQADQKKFIGNSVVPLVVKAWALAMAEPFVTPQKQVA